MAAGGMGRGGGLPLGQRVQAGAAQASPGSAPPRHCWVSDGHDASWPGVLLEWRQGTAGWEGRVAYGVASLDCVRLVEQWVGASHLTPLG